MVYSNADEVELFLNGRSLGRKQTGSEPVDLPVGEKISATRSFSSKYRLLWQVPFEPGTLRAIAYHHGREVARDEVRTAGAPARVRLIADRTTIHADGDDLAFITVRVEDQDGNLCPNADNLMSFRVDGAGTIQAVDNGNAATVEPFHADHRRAFNGLALLILRSRAAQAGKIDISADGDGLAQGSVRVAAETYAGNADRAQ
jgi:beta-galactosidase